MSQTELHRGKIEPIKKIGSLALWAEGYCKIKGIAKLQKPNNNWIEQISHSFYGKFLMVDNQVYEIDDDALDLADDIVEFTPNGDGSYDYFLKYSTGGTGLLKLLGEEIKKQVKTKL